MRRIFAILEGIQSKLTKPNARITVEIFEMGGSSGIRFIFSWYEDKLIKVTVFVSKNELDHILDDEFLVRQIVSIVNAELKNFSMVNAELNILSEGEPQ